MTRALFTSAVVALLLVAAVFGVGIVVVLDEQCTTTRNNYDSIARVIRAATDVPAGSPYSSTATELRRRLIEAQGPRPAC